MVAVGSRRRPLHRAKDRRYVVGVGEGSIWTTWSRRRGAPFFTGASRHLCYLVAYRIGELSSSRPPLAADHHDHRAGEAYCCYCNRGERERDGGSCLDRADVV